MSTVKRKTPTDLVEGDMVKCIKAYHYFKVGNYYPILEIWDSTITLFDDFCEAEDLELTEDEVVSCFKLPEVPNKERQAKIEVLQKDFELIQKSVDDYEKKRENLKYGKPAILLNDTSDILKYYTSSC